MIESWKYNILEYTRSSFSWLGFGASRLDIRWTTVAKAWDHTVPWFQYHQNRLAKYKKTRHPILGQFSFRPLDLTLTQRKMGKHVCCNRVVLNKIMLSCAQQLSRVVDIHQALDARAAGIGGIVGRRPGLRPWPWTPDGWMRSPYPALPFIDCWHKTSANSSMIINDLFSMEINMLDFHFPGPCPWTYVSDWHHRKFWLSAVSTFMTCANDRNMKDYTCTKKLCKTVQEPARPWLFPVQMTN
jgi:hypothetical protein